MPICRLCNKERKLVESHIIPKFMYKGMKDENHSFSEVTYNLETDQNKIRRKQKEDFDPNILCEDCDNRVLGGIEKYAEQSMYGENLNSTFAPRCKNYKNPVDGSEASICTNIDYRKFKLFLLSILWRASISTRPVFKDVSLGPKHEEIIRKMILEGHAPSENEYPIIMTSFMRTNHNLRNLIGQPVRVRMKDGLNGYVFLIDSIQFIFLIAAKNHALPEVVKKLTIKERGEITVVHLPNGKEIEFLKVLFNKR